MKFSKPNKKKTFLYDQSTQSDSESDYNSKIVETTFDNSFCRFNEELGSGSFKHVYKGYDFNKGREVAWSIMKSEDELDLKKVLKEISIMKQLDHPNITKYISGWYDKEKREVVIISELCPGGSILNYLRTITTSPRLKVIKSWIKGILNGLNYLHTEVKPSIIHCDIKCDNVFLDRTCGKVKIGDLGGCEILFNEYATNYIGTVEFMSPEVIEGHYTTKADIYSLGMTIIEMITLEIPYKECGGIVMKIYDNVIKGILPRALLRIKNENIVRIVKMCLQREKDRPTAKDLLLDPFLNDDISEENNHPVQFKNIKEIEKEDNVEIQNKIVSKTVRESTQKRINPTMTLEQNPIATKNTKKNYHFFNNKTKLSLNFQSHHSKSNNKIFDITIYENCRASKNRRILHLTFIVDKKEWVKAKQIDFEYYLDRDTIEDVVNELTNCINLTKNESEIVLKKLSSFLSKYSIISKKSIKRDENLDFFNASFIRIRSKINKLLVSNIYDKLIPAFENCGDIEFKEVVKIYKEKITKLQTINNELNLVS